MRPKTFGTFRETCPRPQLFKVWITLSTHMVAIQRLVLSKWIQLYSEQKFIQCSQVRLLHWDYKSWSHNFFQRLIFYIYFVRYFLVMFLNLIEFITFFATSVLLYPSLTWFDAKQCFIKKTVSWQCESFYWSAPVVVKFRKNWKALNIYEALFFS